MKKINLIIISIALLTMSCTSSMQEKASSVYSIDASNSEVQMDYEKTSNTNEWKESKATNATLAKIPEKIIKTASISMEIKNYNETKQKIYDHIKKHGAYISNEDESNNMHSTNNNITIRVLQNNFDSLIIAVIGEAKSLQSKSINLKDVTEEYTDIVSRLNNKKEAEKRFLEILKQTKTIKEILDVEEHLRTIREEIESKEGRLKFLNDQVAYSTINLSMYQISESSYAPGFWEKTSDGLKGGWKGLLQIIIVIVYLWPLWLIITAVIFIIRKVVRNKRKKQ